MTDGRSTGGSDRGSGPRGAAHLNALPIGTRLAEFEIREVLGEGGFGIVYRAFDHSLGVDAALKEYLPAALAYRQDAQTILPRSAQHRATFDAGLASFLQEARVIAQFDHPALVRVRRIWEANGTAYMAMAFCPGPTLRAAVRQDPAFATQARLESLLRPLLDGVGRLHARHFYHRDIAPDNIIVRPDGQPVLIDFGAARTVIGGMTQALTAVLKPGFAPIEQYADDAQLAQGPWTDVYGFAATLCFAVTGQPPPTAAARALADAMVPLGVRALAGYTPRFLAGIDRGLAVRPQDRPQTLPEFAAALGLELDGEDQRTIIVPRRGMPPPALTPAPAAATQPLAVPAGDGGPAAGDAGSAAVTAVAGGAGQDAGAAAAAAAAVADAVGSVPTRRPVGRPRTHRLGGRVAALALAGGVAVAAYLWLVPGAPPPTVGGSAPPAASEPLAARPGSPGPPARGEIAEAPVPLAPATSPVPLPPKVGKSEPPRAAPPDHAAATAERPGDAGGERRVATARTVAPAVAPGSSPAAVVRPAGQPPLATPPVVRAPAVPPADGRATEGKAAEGKAAEGRAAEGRAVVPLPPADPRAQYELGRNYEAGRGVAKDPVAAVRWFRRAAEAGYRPAMVSLAAACEAGRGTPADIGEAIRWYGRAAELGDPLAQTSLGVIHATGRGVPRDLPAAAGWYRKAADQDYAPAQNNLGRFFEHGWGVARDDAAATRLYERAAAQGHAGAEYNLGATYANGRGVARNDVLAAAWYRKAADHGNAFAQASLGQFYETGRGVFRNADEAFRLYSMAAAQGHAGGQYLLGRAYEVGIGAAKDPQRALYWYRKAAGAGSSEAATRVRQLGAGG